MSNCRQCTAPITWALDPETNEKVPLDDHEQLDYGEKRYRIIRDGNPPQVSPVPEESEIRTYVDHRHICQQPRAI